MEILNNIWMALSTPNEGLMNIIYFIAGIVENFLTMHIFLSIFNINSSKKQQIKYIIFITLVSIFTIYIIPSPFNIFANYLIMIVLIKQIFRLTIFKSILSMICPVIISGLIGSFITNPYLTLLNITSEQLLYIPIYRLGFLLIMYLFLSLVILAVKYRKISLYILEDLDFKTRVTIFINIILGLTALITQGLIIFFYTNILPLWITFLSFISLLAYFSISIYSLTRIFKLTLTTRKLENAESYNNTLRILHDNVREFKHDFDNIVTTIGGYIKTNDMEGLKKYYLELEDN